MILVATGAVSDERRQALETVAEVVDAGDERIDVSLAVRTLASLVGPTVLCEGGPVLNGFLAEADLIDEWCLTLAPTIVAGESKRAAIGPLTTPRPLRLDRAWHHEGELLLRYVRDRST
jgi:riboflavin biosynthesis pyrimidine reductase